MVTNIPENNILEGIHSANSTFPLNLSILKYLFVNLRGERVNAMTTKNDVEQFLNQFKIKLEIYDIVFRMRTNDKNEKTLLALDITSGFRKTVIKNLEVEDYSAGPIPDELYQGTEMWVFGKDVKGQEVYIKISMGKPNMRTICISFHIAEHPMSYPFKTEHP